MRRFGLAVLLAGATVLAAGGSAHAQSACIQNAIQDYQACKDQCADTKLTEKLTCKNIDPVCGTACVQAHQACRKTVETILDTGALPDGTSLPNCSGGTNACDAALATANGACWSQYCASGSTCMDCASTTDPNSCYECVDAAQMVDFSCRDTCRDSFRQNAIVKSDKQLCNKTFQSCIHACPTLAPAAPTPTATP